MIMALPPPDYEDAILYPLSAGISSEALDDVIVSDVDESVSLVRKDSLPSCNAACISVNTIQDRNSSSSASSRVDTLAEDNLSPSLPSTQEHPTSKLGRIGGHDHTSDSRVHDVTIHVTQSDDVRNAGNNVSVVANSSSHRSVGESACDPGEGFQRGTGQCFVKNSYQSCIVTDLDAAAAQAMSAQNGGSGSVQKQSQGGGGMGGGGGDASVSSGPGRTTSSHTISDHLTRRTSEDSQRPLPAIRGCSKDLHLPGLRSQRSCSDAGVHSVSRTRAVAAAESVKLSPHGHHLHQPGKRSHHNKQQCHRSHSCIPGQIDMGSSSSVHNGHVHNHRRAHSHSSLARLGVGKGHGHKDQESLFGLSRSRRASEEEEEVTYVWKDGRVQVHHMRSGMTTPDLSVSGQHVQYMWRNGNVQRVVRGSNNELLAAEVVPPRRERKGINYCIAFALMFSVVFAIAILVFVLKVVH